MGWDVANRGNEAPNGQSIKSWNHRKRRYHRHHHRRTVTTLLDFTLTEVFLRGEKERENFMRTFLFPITRIANK